MMMLLAIFAASCRGGKSSSATGTAPTTQTIAPAAGQPTVNSGDAVTQTVDVEDGRSEAEGAALTNPQTAKTAPPARAPEKAPAKKHR